MEDAAEVQRVIGRYPSSWFDRIVATIAGIVWIFGGITLRSTVAPLWTTTGIVVIAIGWFVPVTVINSRGVRVVRRFKFIHWADVTKVFQPGPGDPVRIQLSTGKRIVLDGVGRDRIPGIVVLATRNADPAATNTGHDPDQPAS